MNIPVQEQARLSDIFKEGALFGAIDSNLEAWLPEDWEETKNLEVGSFQLAEHKDNRELIDDFGGQKMILNITLQPQHIKYLATHSALQTNGLSNLFFVNSEKENLVFIVGVVWDMSISKFVPYIYRTRNLYRAWTKGNKVFVRK
jgi:hypothetical protein